MVGCYLVGQACGIVADEAEQGRAAESSTHPAVRKPPSFMLSLLIGSGGPPMPLPADLAVMSSILPSGSSC